ncbi:MAG TPA: hypothetical protein VIM37_00795 [Candidatus Microsaccharimonas sp.]
MESEQDISNDVRVSVLKLQLSEWRRKVDAIDQSYDRIRGRSITLLTIQLGVTGYFITQLTTIIKPELYGKLFFVIGAATAVCAIALSIRNYRTKHHWASPMYELEIERMNNALDLKGALDILVVDYKVAYENNLSIHQPAANRLNQSLFMFIAAAIILLVLQFAR